MANLLQSNIPTATWNPTAPTPTPQAAPAAAPAATAVAAPKVAAPVATNPVAPPAATTQTAPITPVGGTSSSPIPQPGAYTPSRFTIDTHSMPTSDTMSSNVTSNDVQNLYQQYAQKYAQSQQYSPEYLQAVQGSQMIQSRDAQLQENQLSGSGFAGATSDFAAGVTQRARSQNAVEGLQYTQAQQIQEMIRQGNMGAAKALMDAAAPQSVSPGASLVSPLTGQTTYGGMSGYQDIQNRQTYANLQQTYPDAQIPAYNESLSSSQNLQNAQNSTASAPSFQARQTISVPLPGGGYALVNKNQIAQNSSGSTVLISPSQAALVTAASQNIKDLSSQRAQVSTAITAADQSYPYLMDVVSKAGINDNKSPLANEIQQAYNNRIIGSGDQQRFNVFLESLRAEYTAILARKGGVTNMTRADGEALISGSIGLDAMKSAYTAIQADAKIIMNSYDTEIGSQNKSMQGIYDQGSALGGSVGGGTTATSGGSTDAADPMGLFTK